MPPDKASGPLDLGRADAMNSRTQEMFEMIGVLDDMLSIGLKCNSEYNPFARRDFHSPRSASSTFENGEFTSRQNQWWTALTTSTHANFLMLGQPDVTRVIKEHLNVDVRYNSAVDRVDEDDDGVTIVYNGGQTIRSHYLLGADGARSFIRNSLSIPFEGTKPEMVWAVIDGFLDTDFPVCSEIITFQIEGQSRVSWIPR